MELNTPLVRTNMSLSTNPKIVGTHPMQCIQIDIVDMLKSEYGERYYMQMLVVTDLYSQFVFARALAQHTDHSLIIRHLMDIFGAFGPPEAYRTYATKGIVEACIQDVQSLFNIEIELIGNASRAHYQLRRRTYKRAESEMGGRKHWIEAIPFAVIEHNQTKNAIIRTSPFQIMFGRKPWKGSSDLPPWIPDIKGHTKLVDILHQHDDDATSHQSIGDADSSTDDASMTCARVDASRCPTRNASTVFNHPLSSRMLRLSAMSNKALIEPHGIRNEDHDFGASLYDHDNSKHTYYRRIGTSANDGDRSAAEVSSAVAAISVDNNDNSGYQQRIVIVPPAKKKKTTTVYRVARPQPSAHESQRIIYYRQPQSSYVTVQSSRLVPDGVISRYGIVPGEHDVYVRSSSSPRLVITPQSSKTIAIARQPQLPWLTPLVPRPPPSMMMPIKDETVQELSLSPPAKRIHAKDQE